MALLRRAWARSTTWLIVYPAGNTHVPGFMPAESKLIHQNLLAVSALEHSRVSPKLELIFAYSHEPVSFGAYLDLSITVSLRSIIGLIAFSRSSII